MAQPPIIKPTVEEIGLYTQNCRAWDQQGKIMEAIATFKKFICLRRKLPNEDFVIHIDGMDLSQFDLEGGIFNQCVFNNCNLTGANMGYISLINGSLSGSTLIKARLVNAKLQGATLDGGNFDGANMTRADMYRASIKRASFEHTMLEGANFSEATLEECNFFTANLICSNFNKAVMDDIIIEKAELEGVAVSPETKVTRTPYSYGINPRSFKTAVEYNKLLASKGKGNPFVEKWVLGIFSALLTAAVVVLCFTLIPDLQGFDAILAVGGGGTILPFLFYFMLLGFYRVYLSFSYNRAQLPFITQFESIQKMHLQMKKRLEEGN